MELLACITGLQHAADYERIHEFERVVIFTDSLYVKQNVPYAKYQWSKQKWLNRDGRPIENATLWKDLVRAIKKTPKHAPTDGPLTTLLPFRGNGRLSVNKSSILGAAGTSRDRAAPC